MLIHLMIQAKAGVVTKMMTVLVLVVVMETVGKFIFPVQLLGTDEVLMASNTTDTIMANSVL